MLHRNHAPSDIHAPFSWAVTDEAARLALPGITTTDEGKLCWQTVDNSLWILADSASLLWVPIREDIAAAIEKTTPVDTDMVGLVDSTAGNSLKKLSWANIKATVKTYFDTLYQPADADLTTWAGIAPAANVGTFLATPSSANLAAALTDETGTGAAVFANSPALVTPTLGAALATSLKLGSGTALSDYEEGTWTGTLVPLTSGSITLHATIRTGAYTRVGRQVTITGQFIVVSVVSPTGRLRLSGLPFAAASGTGFDTAVSLRVSGAVTADPVNATIPNVGSFIDFYPFNTAANTYANNVKANTIFTLSATYFI